MIFTTFDQTVHRKIKILDADNAHTVEIIGPDKITDERKSGVLGYLGYSFSVFHLDLDFINMALKQFCLILGKSLF